jgi:micrococcal nuclease
MPVVKVRRHRRASRFIAAVWVALLAATPGFGQSRSQAYLVRRVIDGDTIDLAALGRVSLLGIDAPELERNPERSTPLAREAQQRLSGLLLNRWIRLEYETGSRTASRRSAYVFTEDGRFVNEWLVREGLARVSGRRNLRLLANLEQAESEARRAQRGVWRDRE